jgi:hypothetical protein
MCRYYVMQVIIITVHVCVDSGTPSQATKSGTTKPNSDHGKSVKVSGNSPIHRRKRYSQSTENKGTRWTNSHQHQQNASSSSMSMFSNANAEE